MSVSNIIMYMLPIIVTPILTRLYTPEAFGEWGIFSSFIVMATMVLFLGFENILIQAPEEQLSDAVTLCAIVSLTVITFFALIFGLGIAWGVDFFMGFPACSLLFIYFGCYAIYTICYNLCNRNQLYYTLAISNVVLGGSQAVFRILLALICLQSINGLILGTTMAEGLTALFLLGTLLKTTFPVPVSHIQFSHLQKLVLQYRNFPLYDAPSSLLSFAAFNLPVIILSLYFDKAAIGCFSIVLQLLLLPMSLVGSAIGKVYYQRISVQGQPSHYLCDTTHEALRILCVISVLPLLFIACGGDKLIVLFLGSQWQSAGYVALCLALWSFPTILTQPLLPMFRVLNKQRTMLFYDTLYFLLGIGSIILLCYQTHNLYLILLTYAVVCFFVKIALFFKLLNLCQLHISRYFIYIPLWIISITILTLRLVL